jgi:hypothetical protein
VIRGDIPLGQMPGDQIKVAQAMIDLARHPRPPRRLLLGSDPYARVHDALTQRLEQFESQRDIAMTTDADDYVAATATA